jgi:prolipoprotein diacylglyceryltransferase
MHHPVWNITPEVFRPGPLRLRWYGLFFALGFRSGYEIMAQFYRREGRPLETLSSLFLYLFLGTI